MSKLKVVTIASSRFEAKKIAAKLGDGLYAFIYPLDNDHYGIIRCHNGKFKSVWRWSTLDKFSRDELTVCQ